MKPLHFIIPIVALLGVLLIPDEVDRTIGLMVYIAIASTYAIVAISNIYEEMRQINKRYEEEMKQITDQYRKLCTGIAG